MNSLSKIYFLIIVRGGDLSIDNRNTRQYPGGGDVTNPFRKRDEYLDRELSVAAYENNSNQNDTTQQYK